MQQNLSTHSLPIVLPFSSIYLSLSFRVYSEFYSKNVSATLLKDVGIYFSARKKRAQTFCLLTQNSPFLISSDTSKKNQFTAMAPVAAAVFY